MRKSELWVLNFIENEVLTNESPKQDWLAKVVGEFSLYCYICSSKGGITPFVRETLETLDALHFDSPHFKLLSRQVLGKELDKSLLLSAEGSLEYDFLSYSCFKTSVNWTSRASMFLESFFLNGFNIENAYFLTHVIFYSTDFGKKNYWDSKPRTKNLLSDCLEKYALQFSKEENWDLLQEIYLAQVYLSPHKKNQTFTNFKQIESYFVSKDGWCLSDGKRIEYYERNYHQLPFIQKYSLFHTTIINLMLKIELSDVGVSS